jgi:hypothetical protein
MQGRFKISSPGAENPWMRMARASTERMRWSGWWNLRCPAAIVPLAAAIVAVEALAVWSGEIWRPLGGPGLTPVLPAVVLLAGLVGWRHLGLSERHLWAWWEFAAVMGTLFVAIGFEFLTHVGPLRELTSFFVGATEEELVFRFAAPLAAGGIAAWLLGRSPGDLLAWGTTPRTVAVVTAAAGFTLMPGHLQQVGGAAWRLVPFVAIALLLTYVVLRTGDLLPGMLVHALLNLATVCYLSGGMPRGLWAITVVVGLGSYAWGAERAGRRLGLVLPVLAS